MVAPLLVGHLARRIEQFGAVVAGELAPLPQRKLDAAEVKLQPHGHRDATQRAGEVGLEPEYLAVIAH